MKQANYGPSEIDQLLDTIRSFNTAIGSYEQHAVLTDDFTYSVKLTNGTIRIYAEELQDKKALPQERLRDIAARFNERLQL
jgi:hypothetical protein